jgi:hypothetical protein
MFHGEEMAVLAPLIRSTNFNQDVISACVETGSLPLVIANALEAAKFLVRTVLAAQSAQRTYGVPASVLLAVAFYRSGTTVEGLIADPGRAVEWPGCDCCYSPSVQKWFMDFAAHLVRSAKGRKALELLPGRDFVIDLPRLKLYVRGLGVAGFWDSRESEDIISEIEEHGLDECDRAAIFEPGYYRRMTYKESLRDGGIKLVPVWAEFLQPSSHAGRNAEDADAAVAKYLEKTAKALVELAAPSRPAKSKRVRRSIAKAA